MLDPFYPVNRVTLLDDFGLKNQRRLKRLFFKQFID